LISTFLSLHATAPGEEAKADVNTMKIEEVTEDLASTTISPPDGEPDLLNQAIDAFYTTSTESTHDGTTPALPPALAMLQGKTLDEKLKDLNESPLFMTELVENDDLEALKALAYDGTPLEVAAGFKERGNESFQEKGWKDAKEFYSKAINVLLLEVRKRQKGEIKKGGDEKEEIKVLEASLVNRAASHLELKNYRSCIQDCGSAIRINNRNVKAYYRSSKALLALEKMAEADDACARGLAIDPTNKALLAIAKEIIKKNEIVFAKKKREEERELRKRKEELTLRAAIKARGVKIRKTPQPPEMEDARIELVPDPIDPTSTLNFPAVLLYPLNLESDFIKAWNELEPIGHHLDYILPVPWDQENLYTPNGVECYMETLKGGLIKVGRKVTLLKVLTTGNVEVVDEVVKVFVVPKSKAEAWVTDFKMKKAAQLAA
jgi:tetratricopeptide (TPR) repeat protein